MEFIYKALVVKYRIVLYRDVIDYAIEEILYYEGQYRYLALKRRLEQYLDCKSLSFMTFNNHIQKMVNNRILQKRGRFYRLTEEARNRLGRGETIDPKSYNWRRRPLGSRLTDTIEDDNQYR